MNKKDKILIILGIVFISFNLRAPLTGVGSVIEMIKSEYLLSSSMAGFITTLPLLAFAVVSPFVARLSQKLKYGRTMIIGLVLIFIGILIRSYTNVWGLFIGTLFLGIGIAIGNVLIPSIIKLRFSKQVGMLTSIYTTSMCLFAAVGAGVSIPLAKGLNLGWHNSLAIWGILTIATIIIWSPQLSIKSPANVNAKIGNENKSSSIWKSPLAWWVTLFMGTQSLLFYSLVAWLPSIVMSKGMSDSFAGTMALIYQIIAIPATIIIPILCDKISNQRPLVMLVCSLYLSGMTIFLFGQTEVFMPLAMILMALGQGGSISLSIAFISLRSPNSVRASELSGMAQSAGYLLAAIGPIFMGFIYDMFKNWSLPIVIFMGLILFQIFCGWFAGNDKLTSE
ncbi:MFS transporter, CP family, cyanate transporter [Desulfonispora thiosulfatigenes DSM 11270]|uniref:MFS transporter, CP family, cyanate transporter n=1 Tax=Desulfonispora thiosulfatigenes DSM 11270 TaxID=656914 RepID=A0A1W1VA43_DESTI|nr:MFS transporter [Desulfonispora thiosulfatigenes]SMB90222.1 MFS transporter, CP family, cyanate transporter [Desulfonispora thiosulfatigenes DSM 11270]